MFRPFSRRSRSSKELEETFQYWVNLPNVDPKYFGFFLKFSKGIKIDDKNYIVSAKSEFVGKIFPDFARQYPEIFEPVKETIGEHITDPLTKAVAENKDGLMDAIANDRVVLAVAIFELGVNPIHAYCVQRFSCLSCQTEQQIHQLGVFN